MRRRDFTIGLLLATPLRTVQAQEHGKQHRIAVIIPTGPVAVISDTGRRYWPAFFAELRRQGQVEGQNLAVERYSGAGRPESLAPLAREVVGRNPEVIIATTNPIAVAARAATGTIPIVWIGVEPIRVGLATSLARPGGNVTGVSVDAGYPEMWFGRVSTRVRRHRSGPAGRDHGQRLRRPLALPSVDC
jgi:putative ABC transport system substrate-binding protein